MHLKFSVLISIKGRSTPAPISFKGQVPEHTTVKWSIDYDKGIKFLMESEN